jgi:hypothetical protein
MHNTEETGQPGPKRWLGVGFRLVVTVLFLLLIVALSRCSRPTPPRSVTATTLAATAHLRVEVGPAGALAYVDGQSAGSSPLSLKVPPGQHMVRVEMEGYASLERTVTLNAGDEAVVSGELTPLPPAPVATVTLVPIGTSNTHEPLPDLAIRQVKIELDTGGACDYTSTQLGVRVWIENLGATGATAFVVDVNGSQQMASAGLQAGETTTLWFSGYSHGVETTVTVDATLQVQESDEENNVLSQMVPVPTLPPTCTPPPEVPPTDTPTPPTVTPIAPPPPAAVTWREDRVTIPTYPYTDFVTEARNEAFHMSYAVLDRSAYDASSPAPRDVTYRTVVVENEYLQLTFLPDVGGRLYEVIFKPTGHRETYRNPVLKPSPWGPPEQGWWLAAGGIEWSLPVEEHGYEWGTPWKLLVKEDGNGVTVTVRDTEAQDRVRAEILVRLEAGAGYFVIRPRLENPTSSSLAVKYWTNAMLAPGGRNVPSAGLRFVLPDDVTAITIHSRGDDLLPSYNERMSWPVFDGRDLSRLGNWNRWLGFFEDPAVGEFIAVYDENYDEGMVRVFPGDVARGAKGFGFGWKDPIPASNWTDDGSSYVEIHGGPAPTFEDSVSIPAGGHLEWNETWYPVAGLGGLRHANATAALNLTGGGGSAQVAAAVTRPWSGDVVLLLNSQEGWRQAVSLLPGQTFRGSIPLGADAPQSGRLTLRLEAPNGAVVAEYSADFGLK